MESETTFPYLNHKPSKTQIRAIVKYALEHPEADDHDLKSNRAPRDSTQRQAEDNLRRLEAELRAIVGTPRRSGSYFTASFPSEGVDDFCSQPPRCRLPRRQDSFQAVPRLFSPKRNCI